MYIPEPELKIQVNVDRVNRLLTISNEINETANFGVIHAQGIYL